MFEPPTAKECEEAGVWGIHLGDYIFWDEEKQTEFLKKNYGLFPPQWVALKFFNVFFYTSDRCCWTYCICPICT